jgi:FkbM family methyltransferase
VRELRLLDDTLLYIHDDQDMFSNALVRDQDYYEKEILEYLADKHPQHEVILDIGANIGNHTAYFAQYLEYNQIIAFEPIPDNFELLCKNVGRYPNVQTRRDAVGAERKSVRMMIRRDNMGACEIVEDERGTEIVSMIRVDDLLLSDKVTLMKIDVEWYEPNVLAGADNIIKEDHPLILIEDVKGDFVPHILMGTYKIEKAWPQHRTYLYA